MPGVSIHVVDVSRGVVATGMRVELHAVDAGKLALLARGQIGANGLWNAPELAKTFAAGAYAAVFHVGDFYRTQRVALPAVPFLEAVRFDFGIADPAQHYHLPLKMTPWGLSLFRGGA